MKNALGNRSRQVISGAAFVVCAALLCSLSPRTSRAVPREQATPAKAAGEPLGGYLDFLDRHFSAERLVRDLRYFTSVPHVASSARNYELARFVLDEWKACGLEDVHLAEYDVLLSFPERIRVEIVSPEKVALALREDSYPEDPDTSRLDVGLPYNAYSASGNITAPVVYANSGNPQDYDLLEERGIDLRGKIALVRYSEPYSYRGFKAQTAQKRGLAALLIYSDPQEDGAARGSVFPDGPWGPTSHIQRGGIPFDFIYPGDPLTPGWASVPGAKRLPVEESLTLPKITSVPLSAWDALPILRLLDGPEAPREWAGALLPAYRLGGTSPRVHVDVKMDNSVRRITDVIGCVRGSEEPEALVLLGNHRDAWVFGGLDPSSGTACLMEIARAFGEARKAGFRPRRSVYFASWDAEEFTLTGSTEWGEENRDRLVKGLVAYLNVDSSACGQNFSVSAVPSLSRTILAALRGVADPATGRTVFERWKSGPQGKGAIPTSAGSGRVNPIGSGSDHTVFLNHICAPALDMSFDGDYGVYHSMYDDFYWMSHFGDPGMRYTEALDRIWARIAVDLASRPLVPLDYETYGVELKGYLEEWAKQFDPSKKQIAPLVGLAEEMIKAAAAIGPAFLGERDAGGGEASGTPLPLEKRREADRLLIEVERCFSLETGIPGRTWFKHLVFGTRSTYAALLLPELTEAAEAKNAEGVLAAVAHLQTALERAILKLKEIDGLLAHSGPR